MHSVSAQRPWGYPAGQVFQGPIYKPPISSPKCNTKLFPRQSGWRRRLRETLN